MSPILGKERIAYGKAPRINNAIEPVSQKALKAFADDLGCDLQSTSAICI